MTNSKNISVFLSASIRGAESYKGSYELIKDTLLSMGIKVIEEFDILDGKESANLDSSQLTEYYKKIEKAIKLADIYVSEVSVSSSTIGYEFGFAAAMGKPCLLLRSAEIKKLPGLPIIGNPSKLVSFFFYTERDIKRKIQQFLRKVEKGIFVKRLPIEFTKIQVDYVEYRQRSGGKKISFNSAVRQIIEEAVDADLVYRDLNSEE